MNLKKLFTKRLKCRWTFFFYLILFFGQITYAQENLNISGKVTDSNGATPIPGVTILEKGSNNGALTDMDGNYTLKLSKQDAVLVVSYVGYETQEITAGGQSVINVSLVPIAELKDEVVVVGYGQVKKTDVTGSVSSMSDKALTERSVNNPLEAIQGNVAGVQISSSTGRLGDKYSVTIRGKNSLNKDAKPLYIVDGVATDGIDFLNPEDISRVDILKDASSTAIYGSRGSNGVIIVTTKSGTTSKSGLSVSFDSYYGVKKPTRLPDMMDGQTWWDFHKAAYLSATPMTMRPGQLDTVVMGINAQYPGPGGQNSYLLTAAENNQTFDWYDAVLQDGMMANNYLSISGHGDNVSYNLGIGIQNETGLVQKEKLDKYSIKAGFDHKISKMFSIGTNLTVALSNQEQGNDEAMENAFRFAPLITPYGTDGVTLFNQPGKLVDENNLFLVNKTSTWNPIMDIQNAADLTKRMNLISSSYAEFKPLQWLTLKSTFSIGYDEKNRGQSWGAQTERAFTLGIMSLGQITKNNVLNYTWDNQFNINYTFKENHNLSLLGLQSIYSTTSENSFQYADHMPFETGVYNIGSGTQNTFNMSSSYAKQTLASFALRLNYNFKSKYLLTLSSRWDGSSLLAEGNKWAAFPSGAFAWRISEESFMKGQDIVSNLKYRLSYGYTGNNVISPYSSVSTINKQTFYSFGATTAVGWLPGQLPNPDLTWEKTREFNTGLDFGLLNNRITGTFDYYDRLSDELLMVQQLPKELGWGQMNANVGSVSNKGIEASLTTVNVSTDLITWETTFIFSKNVNKIISLYGQKESDDVGNGWFIGESIDAQYNYKFDGIWQADQAADAAVYKQAEGQARVLDVNGDGVINPTDDRMILGSADPDWTGSFNTKLTVGDFDLSASVLTNQGVFVYSPFHADYLAFNQRGRQKLNVPFYVPANTAGVEAHYTNEYPRPGPDATGGGVYWGTNGVGYYKDASFVKVKNISVGYTLPGKLLSKAKIKGLRIYFNVLDPFVFTEYEGYDPEWAAAPILTGRVAAITYQMGVNLKF